MKEQLDYQQEDFGENDEENQSNPTEAQAVPASAASVSESAVDKKNFVCEQCDQQTYKYSVPDLKTFLYICVYFMLAIDQQQELAYRWTLKLN